MIPRLRRARFRLRCLLIVLNPRACPVGRYLARQMLAGRPGALDWLYAAAGEEETPHA
jgi:hypothetical protein